MVIAVNTRILSGDTAINKFLINTLTAIAYENSSHTFYFICEKNPAVVSTPGNAEYIVLKQRSASPLLWKLWYNYTLPSLLRKIKADVLISSDGICSLRTKVPQYLLVNDLEFLEHPGWYDKKYPAFARSFLPPSLSKAKSIFTFSNHLKNLIASKYKIADDKIEVLVNNPGKNYHPTQWQEKETIKNKYAGGNEYFLFSGMIHERNNLTNLLKAFSVFKKRQKSSMQLLLITDRIPEKNAFVESLRLYKYRNEVKLIPGLDENETGLITGSALCCINLSPLYTDIIFLLSSLQCDVPVIAGDHGQAKELLQVAALYATPGSVDSIASQMMFIYKDENKTNELVEAGRILLAKHAGTNAGKQLWQYMAAAAQK